MQNMAAFIIRICLGSVFLYSGFNKLIRPIEEFQFSLEQYQAFPTWSYTFIGHVIPWSELILGAFLLLGYWRKLSAHLLSLMTLSFIMLLASTMIRGLNLTNCGCFGDAIHLTPPQAIGVDSCLLILLLLVARYDKTPLELDSWIGKS